MKKLAKHLHYFSKTELLLWSCSMLFIVGSFLIFDRENYLTLAASVLGGTSLIFNAKGNPIGQLLIILFSVLYGYISFTCAYYGEMITYLGMTAPMALFSLISWLRHPFNGNKAEVTVNRIRAKEIVFMIMLAGVVTFVFYFNVAITLSFKTSSHVSFFLTKSASSRYCLISATASLMILGSFEE